MVDSLGSRWARYFLLAYTWMGIIHSNSPVNPTVHWPHRKLMSGRGSPEENINQNAAATLLLHGVAPVPACLLGVFSLAGNISCAALSESHARQGLGQDDIRCWRVSRLRSQLYAVKVKARTCPALPWPALRPFL